MNLGWKLAQVVRGVSGEQLLDTYHAERHPVAARVLHNTMAQTALNGPGERIINALRDTMSELLTMHEPRTRIAAMMCGLDIHYDLGDGHSLLGHRMPDLDLHTPTGPTRLFTLLHQANGVLLKFGDARNFDITPWSDQVSMFDVHYSGGWNLPIIGEVATPQAVLVRPDGYVAWVENGSTSGLPAALDRWFT